MPLNHRVETTIAMLAAELTSQVIAQAVRPLGPYTRARLGETFEVSLRRYVETLEGETESLLSLSTREALSQ